MEPRPRERWANGDFVVCEMLDSGPDSFRVETPSGDYRAIGPGDRIIGALGTRAATLEAVGDWREVREDLVLDTLTAAGVLGRCTSRAISLPPMTEVRYLGHAIRDGEVCTMSGSVESAPLRKLEAPVVLIIGTSMDAGKTVTAAAIVRELSGMGMRVAGAKLTGVGRYRDILAMRRAGAGYIADFVDAGLPSTVVPSGEFASALTLLCSKLAAAEPEVVVAEAGASPLEPYNGDVAMRLLADNVRVTVLCASDPYAVVGVISAFGTRPDLIAGRATSTEAAIDLVEKLVSLPAINVLDPASGPKLASFLRERLSRTG
ncbi:MAG TPA: DUF1611 domain-containing protein [Solirubrobacterales bacterium]|nr:DUF1611 domain-containing protein [Solirubrobacterales bacterium]